MSDIRPRTSTKKLVMNIFNLLHTIFGFFFVFWKGDCLIKYVLLSVQTAACWSFCSTRTRHLSTTVTWWPNWSWWTARWGPCCTTSTTCRVGWRKGFISSRATWDGQVRHGHASLGKDQMGFEPVCPQKLDPTIKMLWFQEFKKFKRPEH